MSPSEQVGKTIKNDLKMIRQFDGSAATIKKIPPFSKISEL